ADRGRRTANPVSAPALRAFQSPLLRAAKPGPGPVGARLFLLPRPPCLPGPHPPRGLAAEPPRRAGPGRPRRARPGRRRFPARRGSPPAPTATPAAGPRRTTPDPEFRGPPAAERG